MIKNNAKFTGNQSIFQEGQVLQMARKMCDWNISRNRFWGRPIPDRRFDNCGSNECIPSLKVKKRSEKKKNSLKRRVNSICIALILTRSICFRKCRMALMKRIPEVLIVGLNLEPCLYAQLHYPFENKEEFEANFPAILL